MRERVRNRDTKYSKFGFEELEVWKKAVSFSIAVIGLVEKLESSRQHYRLVEQIEASATSIAMNLRGENLAEAYEQRELIKSFLKNHLIVLKGIDEPKGVDGLYVRGE